ncbi:MAG TPA: hypothetical protein DD422_04255 [Akkermansia sp.]|nr:hypothetical protein [Akkermansia sp.]HBN17242.1 hypothetical protein [Akkermansia sp.]
MINQNVNAAVRCLSQTLISNRKHEGENPREIPSVFSAAHYIPQEILDSPALLPLNSFASCAVVAEW